MPNNSKERVIIHFAAVEFPPIQYANAINTPNTGFNKSEDHRSVVNFTFDSLPEPQITKSPQGVFRLGVQLFSHSVVILDPPCHVHF